VGTEEMVSFREKASKGFFIIYRAVYGPAFIKFS
jgi:hypothetical protein